jgi:NifU-like protein involved in Fe-S cluster formation
LANALRLPYIGGMSDALYNVAILRLAASVPHATRLAAPQASVVKVSPVCGSRVTVDIDVDAEGRVARIGQEVRACALGQASAALMGAEVIGRTPGEIAAARDGLAAFLKGEAEHPGDWPGLDLFAPARPHKARHASILLAFDAGAEAAANAVRAPALSVAPR